MQRVAPLQSFETRTPPGGFAPAAPQCPEVRAVASLARQGCKGLQRRGVAARGGSAKPPGGYGQSGSARQAKEKRGGARSEGLDDKKRERHGERA